MCGNLLRRRYSKNNVRFIIPVTTLFSLTHVNNTLHLSINSPLARPTVTCVYHLQSSLIMFHHRTHTFHISPMARLRRSSTFQSTFSDALRVYKRRIKIDLLLHPLAARMRPCDTPHAIISVLQEQAKAVDQSLTKLLQPTVNVIYALSLSLQEGVDLVNIGACLFGTCPAPFYRYYPQRKSYLLASVSSLW